MIGVVCVDLCSPITVPIALLGFASTAGVNDSKPPGASETGGGNHPSNHPRMRYAVERVDPGLVDLSEIVKTGGCTPTTPPQTISGGQGRLGTMKKLLLCRRGVAPPRPPRRRYQVGRVDLGFGKIYLSSNIVPIGILWTGFTFAPPLQSLSPCWGSPQRQGQAKRSPWECLNKHAYGGLHPPDPPRAISCEQGRLGICCKVRDSPYRHFGVRRSGRGRPMRNVGRVDRN